MCSSVWEAQRVFNLIPTPGLYLLTVVHHTAANLIHHVLYHIILFGIYRLKHETSRDGFAAGFVLSYLVYTVYIANYGLHHRYLAFFVHVLHTLVMLVRNLQTELRAWQRAQDQLNLLRLYEEMMALGRQAVEEPSSQPQIEPENRKDTELPNTHTETGSENVVTEYTRTEAAQPVPNSDSSPNLKGSGRNGSIPKEEVKAGLAAESGEGIIRLMPVGQSSPNSGSNKAGTGEVDTLEGIAEGKEEERDGSSSGVGEEGKRETGAEVARLLGQVVGDEPRATKLRTIREVESRMELSSSHLPVAVDAFDSRDVDEGSAQEPTHRMHKYNNT